MEDPRNEFQRRIGVGERQHGFGRFVGTSKEVPVPHEQDGLTRPSGKQTYHWDGRVDATVFARPVRLRPATDEVRTAATGDSTTVRPPTVAAVAAANSDRAASGGPPPGM